MLQIQEFLLPKGHPNRPGHPMDPEGVIFHATSNYNKSAGDELHVKYLLYAAKNKSWHVTVDHDSATRHIPYNENAWAAGDGANGRYNRKWIHLEIACSQVNPGEKLDKATYDNAVDVLAQIVAEFNFPFDKLQPHEVVYGKNCPQITLFDRIQLKKDVFNLIEKRKKILPVPQSFVDVRLGKKTIENNLIIDNLTWVPLRFFANELGHQVGWDNKTRTAFIEKGGK